ncbi:MAG: 6-bladed beta-propeller [Bacteroidales bacterium]|nr:6-bladed beta-propeller [Bacteroidales bacterium]
MKKSILSALTALMLASCANVNTNDGGLTVIDVENPTIKEPLPLEQLIESAQLVPLTGDSLLLSVITTTEYAPDRIITVEGLPMITEPVKIFDLSGKLIAAIHKGQGPGEIAGFPFVHYDSNTQQIICDNGNIWKLYSKDGAFIGDQPAPYQFSKMQFLNGEYLFYAADFQLNDTLKRYFFVTDKDFKIKYSSFPITVSRSFSLSSGGNLELNGDHAVIVRDTVYYYQDSKLEPKYYFKFANRFSADQMPEGDVIDLSKIDGFLPGTYRESSKTQFFQTMKPSTGEVKVMVRDIKSGNNFTSDNASFEKNTLSILTPIRVLNDKCVCMITGDNFSTISPLIKPFLDAESLKIMENYNEDSNPMLLFYTTKEF